MPVKFTRVFLISDELKADPAWESRYLPDTITHAANSIRHDHPEVADAPIISTDFAWTEIVDADGNDHANGANGARVKVTFDVPAVTS